ncbi:PREDICTED: protein VPRBP-like [Acropora digitifera]|uniref:protein VPRBP-like n=1 Tax=Acropora digitifera TaxID=70779 RepID=UPI00077A1B55|nr:PREDICTED: protein VPRBP-like [Acropora digitifera]
MQRKVDRMIRKGDIVMGSQSAITPLQSEPCNDSYCGAELNATSVDTLVIEHEVTDKRNSDSEEQEDDGNSDIDHDGYEEEEDEDDFNDGDGVDFIDDNDIECDINSDGKTDMDTETSGCDSDGNALSTAAVPAKNLQRSQDGHVVLLWTREDDRTILQACQKMGAKLETFQHIANTLKNKTTDEVR